MTTGTITVEYVNGDAPMTVEGSLKLGFQLTENAEISRVTFNGRTLAGLPCSDWTIEYSKTAAKRTGRGEWSVSGSSHAEQFRASRKSAESYAARLRSEGWTVKLIAC